MKNGGNDHQIIDDCLTVTFRLSASRKPSVEPPVLRRGRMNACAIQLNKYFHVADVTILWKYQSVFHQYWGETSETGSLALRYPTGFQSYTDLLGVLKWYWSHRHAFPHQINARKVRFNVYFQGIRQKHPYYDQGTVFVWAGHLPTRYLQGLPHFSMLILP